MGGLTRVSISLEAELLGEFDRLAAGRGYPTRSEALKALMRAALVEERWTGGGRVAGAVTLLYDHHRGGVVAKLMRAQHDFGELIVSTQHVHLDHHHCLEIVAVRGPGARIRRLVARLRAVKGVEHCSVLAAGAGGPGQ